MILNKKDNIDLMAPRPVNHMFDFGKSLRSFLQLIAKIKVTSKMAGSLHQLPEQCILLSDRLTALGIDWKKVKVIQSTLETAHIRLDFPLCIGDPIELEYIRHWQNNKEIIVVHGHVVNCHAVTGEEHEVECEVALKNREIRLSRESNLLWNVADLHCQVLDYLTIYCKGKAVENLEQCQEAYKILHRRYVKHNLSDPKSSQMYYTPYHLTPDARIFLLEKKGQFWGTVSLFPDSPLGIPMEATFPEEVQRLRQQGRRIAEIGSLALDVQGLGQSGYSFKSLHRQAYLFKLFKTLFDYARFVLKPTDIVIGVQPKHEVLYEYLNFEKLASGKQHVATKSVTATIMRLDLKKAERNMHLLQGGPGAYFLRAKEAPQLKYFSWDAQSVESFLFEKNRLWDLLTAPQKLYFKHAYPAIQNSQFKEF